MLDELQGGFQRRDRLALSKLLSLAARGAIGADFIARLAASSQPGAKPAKVAAFTGSGGVGKSSLIGTLIARIRQAGLTVAVLACDPQSSLSGGALLGDRFRMTRASDVDDGVFIRSLAAPSGHGAIADHLDVMCLLLEKFGFDVILLETVGAGQGDVAVRGLADVVVLLLQPETGDDLQWEKAGVLEVADIVVVHKGDLPGAESVVAQVKAALELSHAPPIPVLKVSARTGLGVDELWQAIENCPPRRGSDAAACGEFLRLLQETIAGRFHDRGDDPELARIVSDWHQGALTGSDAVDAALRTLVK